MPPIDRSGEQASSRGALLLPGYLDATVSGRALLIP